MNTVIKLIPAVALAALFLASPQAQSAPSTRPIDGPHKTVRFGDLNLSKPHDVEVLYRRIRIAARIVCTAASGSWDSRQSRNWLRCFSGATEEAVLRVNQPTLTAFHGEQTKRGAG